MRVEFDGWRRFLAICDLRFVLCAGRGLFRRSDSHIRARRWGERINVHRNRLLLTASSVSRFASTRIILTPRRPMAAGVPHPAGFPTCGGARAGCFQRWLRMKKERFAAVAKRRTGSQWGTRKRSFFDVLRVRPMLGRPFSAEEEQPGKACSVVVSAEFWCVSLKRSARPWTQSYGRWKGMQHFGCDAGWL